MKITSCRTWLVEGIKYNWTLMRIETDAGVHGWGEATNWPGSPLVAAACGHVGNYIIGLDARQIDFIWTKLYRDMHWLGQAGPLLSAISAVDIALWDIKGKALGAPVYELLGGRYRDRIQLYANYWFIDGGHRPEDYARQVKEVVARGFTGLKLDPFAHVNYRFGSDLAASGTFSEEQKRLAVDVVAAVAQAAGPDVAIAIETHAFLNAPTAVEMARRLAATGFNCMWYEEPALPEFPDAIADIRRQIPLPVCVGERLHSRFMLRPVLEEHAADIVMPDITRCGGISEMRKMANLAETHNVPIAPHNPNGPLSTIASAHVMAAVPNFFRQEFMFKDVSWRDECLSHPLPIENGSFVLPDRPGLGVDVDERILAAHQASMPCRKIACIMCNTMTHDPNCSYCTKSETLQLLMVEVAEMPASTVYFWRNGRYPGRCVVALKGHERELFHLTPARRRQFMDEVSAVAEAIQAAFHADKINYAVYGDVVSHVHVHLVPKQKDGPEWGVPFTINPDVPDAMSEEEIQSCLATLRARLGQARAETH